MLLVMSYTRKAMRIKIAYINAFQLDVRHAWFSIVNLKKSEMQQPQVRRMSPACPGRLLNRHGKIKNHSYWRR